MQKSSVIAIELVLRCPRGIAFDHWHDTLVHAFSQRRLTLLRSFRFARNERCEVRLVAPDDCTAEDCLAQATDAIDRIYQQMECAGPAADAPAAPPPRDLTTH